MLERIKWLESLVQRASDYIKKLEAERRQLINDYWKYYELWQKEKKEKRKYYLKAKALENENKALKLLLKELYNELENRPVEVKKIIVKVTEKVENKIDKKLDEMECKQEQEIKTLKELKEKVQEISRKNFKIYA